MGTGYDHSCDNTIMILAVNLYCMVKGIPVNGLTGCSFRKAGLWECQPDIAYYIGDRAQSIPRGTKIVDLNQYSAPDLAIEVSDSTLSDDLGNKRLLYEEVSVTEYWVVDVKSAIVRAFAVSNGGSRRLSESLVFPGLKISLLEVALQRSREIDQSQVGAWLMQEFQAI
jgi:Uma2 family endonuclease